MKKPFLFIRWIVVICIILFTGIAGFMIIEKYSFLSALYMTVITIATIGYQEEHPLSPAGKIFNIIYIISSFAVFTFALTRLTQYVVSGELAEYLKNRKLMQAIKHFNNHVILCGFGRNGKQAAQTLKAHKMPFVVIESNPEHITEWLESDPALLHITGNATDDETLIKAGISKARALVTTLPSDADNVFIVLSARTLNPDIQIISRASHSASVTKLKTAGADHVISPDKIGGTHMATLVSKPDVIEFIDYLSDEQNEEVSMESIDYEKLPAGLRNKKIADVMEWQKTGVICIGIKNAGGQFVINPPATTLIEKNMKIIVLGTASQIQAMHTNLQTAR